MMRTRRIATIVTLGLLGALAGATTASAGGGGHCAPSDGAGTRVELRDACFQPSTLRIDAGDSVTFVNRDAFDHNVSGTGWGDYDGLAPGQRFTMSFADEGIYPYACTLHPGMNGVVLVGGASANTAVTPLTVRPSPPPSSGGSAWIAAGVLGLLVGAAAGIAATNVRRRALVA